MIRQKIVLPQYDNWEIDAYYAVSQYYVEDIMDHLYRIGIRGRNAKEAYENLTDNRLDTGLCYSNKSMRKSVIVVALASSPKEYLNSITHEATHACVHIADEMGVNHRSEDFAYMVGELCREIYPRVCHLLCNCHEKEQKRKRYEM